jgi:hypothetical protein
MAVTLTYHGETHTIVEWAHRTGIAKQTLWSRYELGWSAARALTTPVRAAGVPRPTPAVAPSPFAPHIAGPAILLGGQWVPAQVWLEAMEKQTA